MFCTTECWSCEDKGCKHYISKTELYFENQQLKDRINKAIELLKKHKFDLDYEPWSIYKIEGNILFDLVKILEEND